MKLKFIFPRRSGGTQRIRADAPRQRTRPIKCHDCPATAHITLYSDGSHKLPPGWVMAWAWFRPVYTCPTCGAKRRQYVYEEILGIPDPRRKEDLQ